MTTLPDLPRFALVIEPSSLVLPVSTCLRKHVLIELAGHIRFWLQNSFSKQFCCLVPRCLLRFSKGQDLASFRQVLSPAH